MTKEELKKEIRETREALADAENNLDSIKDDIYEAERMVEDTTHLIDALYEADDLVVYWENTLSELQFELKEKE